MYDPEEEPTDDYDIGGDDGSFDEDPFFEAPALSDDAPDDVEAKDGAYWTTSAALIARAGAQRLLDSPEIAAARANIRARLAELNKRIAAGEVPF